MAIAPASPHSTRPYGWITLSELGSTADENFTYTTVTDHCQDIGALTTSCRAWSGLTPNAEYAVWLVSTGGDTGASVNFRMVSSASALTAAIILTGPIVPFRVVPAFVYKMPPGHTFLGFRNTFTTAHKISIARLV